MAAWTRRTFLASGFSAAGFAVEGHKGASFPSAFHRYADPATDLEVFRLTDPSSASMFPAYYNRAIAKNSAWSLFACDRPGSPQAFRLDLKNGETRQLTDTPDLDVR